MDKFQIISTGSLEPYHFCDVQKTLDSPECGRPATHIITRKLPGQTSLSYIVNCEEHFNEFWPSVQHDPLWDYEPYTKERIVELSDAVKAEQKQIEEADRKW